MSADPKIEPRPDDRAGEPLVPLLPVFAVIGLLRVLAAAFGRDAADGARRVAHDLELMAGALADESITASVAEREGGANAQELVAQLRAHAEDERWKSLSEDGEITIRRWMLWLTGTNRDGLDALRSILLPLDPVLSLLGSWFSESGEPLGEGETKAAAEAAKIINSVMGDRVPLAQAARELGIPPDELLAYMRSGRLANAGDARQPRVVRVDLFRLRANEGEQD